MSSKMTSTCSSTDDPKGLAHTVLPLKSSLKPCNKRFPSKPLHQTSLSPSDSDEEEDCDLRATLRFASYQTYSDEEDGDYTDSDTDYSDASAEALPSFARGADCDYGGNLELERYATPDLSSESILSDSHFPHPDTFHDTRHYIPKCSFNSCSNEYQDQDVAVFDDDSALPDIASFPDRLPCISEEEDDTEFGAILESDEPLSEIDFTNFSPSFHRGGFKPLSVVFEADVENHESPLSSSSPSLFSDRDISLNCELSSPSSLQSDSSGVTSPISASQSPQSSTSASRSPQCPTSSSTLCLMKQKCACTSSECEVLMQSLVRMDLQSEFRGNGGEVEA